MPPKPALLIGVALLGAGALVHGATTHRWSAFAPAPGRAEAVHALTVHLGDYEAVEVPNDIPLKEKSVATNRRYTSAARAQSVMVSVVSGPAGSVSTHTPDVCYPSSGYKTVRGPKRETIALPGGGSASYFVADFEKTTAATTDRQRVRWAWSADGAWAAPDNPRFAYLRAPELFKLYIVTPVADAEGAEDPPAVRQFAAAALAEYSGLFAGR